MVGERLGREPGPDHEAVGGRIAGGDAQAERIAAEALRADDGGSGEGRGGGACDEVAAVEHQSHG